MAENERKKIGKYDVVGIIGRGGMGIVYRAVDPGIGRMVAIKMTTGAIVEDVEMLKRFTREAQSVGSLQHPNIVTVYDLGIDDQNPYLVMELLDGESLEQLAQNRVLSLEEKLDIVIQICTGIQYAHQRNVIHRDLKPANIMILKDGTAKIVDFGIARAGMQKLTRPGQLVGSFQYMSPEQINGANVDARSDVFSIGVLLFQLVSGTLPFDGKDTGEVLMKVLHQPAPALGPLTKDCPPELAEIVRRALAKSPDERYQTADEMSLDLGNVLESWRRERVSEYLQMGEKAAAQGQWSRAKEQLLQVLKRERQNTRANAMLREVQLEILKQQRGERAKELLAEAERALVESKPDDALAFLNEAAELDPGNQDVSQLRDVLAKSRTRHSELQQLMQKAELAQDAGDLEEAQRAVAEGLNLEPNNTEFHSLQIVLARELAGRDKQKKVQEFLGEARKQISSRRFTGALEILKKAESLDPSATVVQELITLASTGQQQEKRREDLQRLTAQIEEALAKEDYNTASARIEEGLQSYCDDRGLLKLRAVVQKQRGDTEKNRYIEQQRTEAQRLADSGQGAEAVTVLRSALEKYPAEPFLQAMLGMVEQNLDRTRREQEKTEVLQTARDAIRRKAYLVAIAILEAARKQATSSEYEDLLQFAQNEAEKKARGQKVDIVAEEARRLSAEGRYGDAISLLKITLKEIPDQELEIVLADLERHLDEVNAGVDGAIATAERLLRLDRYEEAIKLLEGKGPQLAHSERFQQTLEHAREQYRAVRITSVLKMNVRDALAAGDIARARALCQEFRSEPGAPEITLVENEIEAKQRELASARLETALRDARLLVTVKSPDAALTVLESVEDLVPSARTELREKYELLRAFIMKGVAADGKSPSNVADSATAVAETAVADPNELQSMLEKVSLMGGKYRDNEKVQSAISAATQRLTQEIQVLRESSHNLKLDVIRQAMAGLPSIVPPAAERHDTATDRASNIARNSPEISEDISEDISKDSFAKLAAGRKKIISLVAVAVVIALVTIWIIYKSIR